MLYLCHELTKDIDESGSATMDLLNARPQLLRQANLTQIRKAIIGRGNATRAEIASETGIGSTTVRTLLTELLQAGELECSGYDESSGGRKAQRYRLRPDRYHAAAFCISEQRLDALLVNVSGKVVQATTLSVQDEDYEQAIVDYLDKLTTQLEIRAIGLGVPGIVQGDGYWRKGPQGAKLCYLPVGKALAERYRLPVVLENDLNAIAIGFGRCYRQQFPQEDAAETNMAYLHFAPDCVSGGFLVGGRVVRGCSNFAGELGFVPTESGQSLDSFFATELDDPAYVRQMVSVVSWVCGILNPRYIALGGPNLRKHCIGPVGDGLAALLPNRMSAELLYAPDVWHDYHSGIAQLTASRMFDDVQFIKE